MTEPMETILQAVRRQDPDFELLEHEFVPWARLDPPLSRCRLGLITTAGVYLRDGFHAPFAADHPHGDATLREIPRSIDLGDLRVGDREYDPQYAETDMNVVLPLDRLQELARMGQVGEVAPLLYSLLGYNTRPLRLLSETVPNLLQRLRRMQVDAVLVTAAGPVGHQTAALVARTLEAAGIPTLAVGVFPQVWERVRPPRAVWCQFPAGAPCGPPGNVGKQQAVLEQVLDQLEAMERPGSIVPLPFRWGVA